MTLAITLEPYFRRPTALDDIKDFLIEVLFRIEHTGRRNLDEVTAPFAFGAKELNEAAAAAHAWPRCERQVLHLTDADVAKDRNALGFHE